MECLLAFLIEFLRLVICNFYDVWNISLFISVFGLKKEGGYLIKSIFDYKLWAMIEFFV